MKKNLLLVNGGGPTAVMNASLCGVLKEAASRGDVGHIYGADGGTGGLLAGNLIALEGLTEAQWKLLMHTPGSAIGTSRDVLEAQDYETMARVLAEKDIGYVLFNGGNGSMDACGKLYRTCRREGWEIGVMGIPKTMDNDLAVTDHCPGYGSAARYVAQSVKEVCADVKSLPIHVVVVEALGRNAGWITGAASLADDGDGLGPDLVYLPERPFDEDAYLEDIARLLKQKSGIVVVASEGLKDASGTPIVDPAFTVGRSTYFGDVSSHLASLVIRRLGYKARGEKPGLLARASIAMQSWVDRDEALLAGQLAARAVLDGETGKMVAFRRLASDPYEMEPFYADLEEVGMVEHTVPDDFINEAGNGVTEAFRTWCRPLIGGPLPGMITLR